MVSDEGHRPTEVCPLPGVWAKIHQQLLHAVSGNPAIPPPPVPLILGGWAYSNDVQKRDRWHATLRWAERYGLTYLIGKRPADSMHAVNQLTSYTVGPLGGPVYLEWTFDQKPKISREAAKAAAATLRANWQAIAGSEVGRITTPLRLTGAKRRRLLVLADSGSWPPWGTWTQLARGEARRAFTRLRAAVNLAIAPHEVDHIDFVHEPTQPGF